MTQRRIIQLICVIWLAGAAVFTFVNRDVWPVADTIEDTVLEGVVHELVEREGFVQKVRLRVDGIDGRVEAAMGAYPELRVGDVVRVECDLKSTRDMYVENFRYDRYLAKERVYSMCRSYSSPKVLERKSSLRSRLFDARDGFEGVLGRYLGEPHGSLLVGLLWGARSTMPDELIEQFRRTGTMHIVAVSGFNVMVVTSALMGVLTFCFMRRQRAFVVVMIGIITFVVLAGADPAVVRAGLMGGLVLIAHQLGRPSSNATLLLLAASIMTAFNPRVLLFDAGFHLSFAAAIGLLYFGKKLERALRFVPEVFGARRTLSETLAATGATFPIMLLHFKQVSITAPIANLFVVPWIPLAMGLGFGGGVLSAMFEILGLPGVSSISMLPAHIVLDIMLKIVEILSPLPYIDFSV